MHWGKWIVVAFVLFAAFIGVLVVISMRQDVNLVASDYYQQELKYQDQIERINNTNTLAIKPKVNVNAENLTIDFPDRVVEQGKIHIFRPSDARLDQHFSWQSTGTEIQKFNLKPLNKGMYKIKLEWTMEGKEYFMEEIISI